MAAAYTKEFLVNAFLSRYGKEDSKLRKLAEDCYDKYGKEKFRTYASLDAEAIRKYKETL